MYFTQHPGDPEASVWFRGAVMAAPEVSASGRVRAESRRSLIARRLLLDGCPGAVAPEGHVILSKIAGLMALCDR